MAKYLEKLRNFRLAIQQNGGIVGSYLSLFRTEEIKYGNVVGTDSLGNTYYENKAYMMGRSRWVVYSPQFGHDYDGSQVPSEWHRWLHYIGDHPPTVEAPYSKPWMGQHKDNPTGTDRQYVPYSTTRPKIEAWTPPRN